MYREDAQARRILLMSRAEQTDGRLSALLRLLCDEKLSEDDSAELAQLLATSEVARQRYVETMQLCNDLADWSQAADAVSILYPIAEKVVNGESIRGRLLRAKE